MGYADRFFNAQVKIGQNWSKWAGEFRSVYKGVILHRNARTERCGRTSAPALATGVARPHSLK